MLLNAGLEEGLDISIGLRKPMRGPTVQRFT